MDLLKLGVLLLQKLMPQHQHLQLLILLQRVVDLQWNPFLRMGRQTSLKIYKTYRLHLHLKQTSQWLHYYPR